MTLWGVIIFSAMFMMIRIRNLFPDTDNSVSGKIISCRHLNSRIRTLPGLFLLAAFCFILLISWLAQTTIAAESFATERQEMVKSQIQRRGIADKSVLQAMLTVPRHLFVPKKLRIRAYGDFPLPIGHGQTISQPYIVAYMTEIIEPEPHYRVLEIGTGSGYQAAVLAQLVDRVYSVEIIPELATGAEKRFRQQGIRNVQIRKGDGYYGCPEAAPFDAIVVTAAAEFIPPPLIQQLKVGGRMIIPVGSPFQVQHLMLVEKKQQDEIVTRNLMPVRFVPFRRAK